MKWNLLSRESTNVEVVPGPPPSRPESVPDSRGGSITVDIDRMVYAAGQVDELREELVAARRAVLSAGLTSAAFGWLRTAEAFTRGHSERQAAADTEVLAMIHAADRLHLDLRDSARRFRQRDEQAAAEARRVVDEFLLNLRNY